MNYFLSEKTNIKDFFRKIDIFYFYFYVIYYDIFYFYFYVIYYDAFLIIFFIWHY